MGSETVIYVLYAADEAGIKGEKYILLLRAYFTTIKGDASKTQLSHIIELQARGPNWSMESLIFTHNHIFSSVQEMCKKARP